MTTELSAIEAARKDLKELIDGSAFEDEDGPDPSVSPNRIRMAETVVDMPDASHSCSTL